MRKPSDASLTCTDPAFCGIAQFSYLRARRSRSEATELLKAGPCKDKLSEVMHGTPHYR